MKRPRLFVAGHRGMVGAAVVRAAASDYELILRGRAELDLMDAAAVGYEGELVFDPSMPDGTPRKLLDVNRITATGWRPTIGLEEGLRRTYADFLREQCSADMAVKPSTQA